MNSGIPHVRINPDTTPDTTVAAKLALPAAVPMSRRISWKRWSLSISGFGENNSSIPAKIGLSGCPALIERVRKMELGQSQNTLDYPLDSSRSISVFGVRPSRINYTLTIPF
jgi:hypothetical protein